MIIRLTPPLLADSDCHQVSCQFDDALLREDTADQLGLTLPATLDRAVQKRKAEFLAGRYCARAALAQHDGSAAVDIGIGTNREPLWPPGFVGSITHTQGYASAIVARQAQVRALGLDSEAWIDTQKVASVSPQILTPRDSHGEQVHLFDSPSHYLTLVFSAKESLFKCLFPLVNRFFDFQAATISPLPSGSPSAGTFRFELLEDLSAEFCAGYSGYGSYALDTDCAHTAIILTTQAPD